MMLSLQNVCCLRVGATRLRESSHARLILGAEQVKATRRVAHQRVHDSEDAAAALTAGLLQGGYQATALKQSAKPSPLRHVTVFTLGSGGDIEVAAAQAAKVAQGTALARCAARPIFVQYHLEHAQQRPATETLHLRVRHSSI